MANTTHRGHGGAGGKQMRPMDVGAVGSGTTEYKEVAWINDYFLKMTKWVDASDYSGRTVNQNLVNIVNNVNRVAKWSNINVSHHFNAFNGKATGAEVWYYLGDAKGRALAEKVSAAISKALGIPNRGAKATTNLYVVSNTVGTTILIEWAFVDNASDMKKWNANKVNTVNAVLEVLGYKGNASSNKPSKPSKPAKPNKPSKTIEQLANEVIAGKHGSGEARKKSLGKQYSAVQKRVNEKLGVKPNKPSKKSIDTIAREVIRGDWGNGQSRYNRLKKAGYNPDAVQRRVNQLM